jgi:hypothetical protein
VKTRDGSRAGATKLRDVAQRAGVSTASVSRFVNDPATVSQELRTRIESAIAELAYVPHWAARALASKRSHTIGAVVPTLKLAIFGAGIEALQERLHDSGYTLLFASCQYDLTREVERAGRQPARRFGLPDDAERPHSRSSTPMPTRPTAAIRASASTTTRRRTRWSAISSTSAIAASG